MELHTRDSFLPRAAGAWCYEAAEVGLKPGEEPPRSLELIVDGSRDIEGKPFRLTYYLRDTERTHGGDALAWTYACAANPGHTVRIFND